MDKTEVRDLHLEVLEKISSAAAVCDLMLDAEYRGMLDAHYRDLPSLLRAISEDLAEAQNIIEGLNESCQAYIDNVSTDPEDEKSDFDILVNSPWDLRPPEQYAKMGKSAITITDEITSKEMDALNQIAKSKSVLAGLSTAFYFGFFVGEQRGRYGNKFA